MAFHDDPGSPNPNHGSMKRSDRKDLEVDNNMSEERASMFPIPPLLDSDVVGGEVFHLNGVVYFRSMRCNGYTLRYGQNGVELLFPTRYRSMVLQVYYYYILR